MQAGRFTGGRRVVAIFRDGLIDAGARPSGVAEEVNVDPVLAALEVQIDQRASAAATAAVEANKRLIGANLFAHDHDLVHSPAGARSRVASKLFAVCRKASLLPHTK